MSSVHTKWYVIEKNGNFRNILEGCARSSYSIPRTCPGFEIFVEPVLKGLAYNIYQE